MKNLHTSNFKKMLLCSSPNILRAHHIAILLYYDFVINKNKWSKYFDKSCAEWPHAHDMQCTLHVPLADLSCVTDRQTDTVNIGKNSLHLMHWMQPNKNTDIRFILYKLYRKQNRCLHKTHSIMLQDAMYDRCKKFYDNLWSWAVLAMLQHQHTLSQMHSTNISF